MNSSTDSIMTKITFTGDVMCEHTRLNQFLNNKKYDFRPVFENVIPVFKKSDYVVANLETPLAGKELVYSERNYSFNTPDEMAEALKNAGVDLVTTANNHVLDRGIAGLERTIDVLDRHGLSHTGSYRKSDKPEPFIKTIGGIKVAFLSYTYGTEACFNNHYLKDDEGRMVNLTREQELSNPVKRYFLVSKAVPAKAFRFVYRTVLPDKAGIDVSERREKDTIQKRHIESDIRYCNDSGADYVIMCLHSGGQFNDEPTAYTRKTAAFCLESGADAVIINHEHIIQRAEFKDHSVIAYCLGNFTSNYGIHRKPMDKHAEYSALFHLYLDKEDTVTAKYSVTFVRSHPDKNGVIITTPVYQLYELCEDEEGKKELMQDNLWCLNTFFDLSLTDAPMRDEYFADDPMIKEMRLYPLH